MAKKRATESAVVINAIAEFANTRIPRDNTADPKPNVIEMLQGAKWELLKNTDLNVTQQLCLDNEVNAMVTGLLRATAIESKNERMMAVTGASDGLEAITGTHFLETTRRIKTYLAHAQNKNFSGVGTYARVGREIADLEAVYLKTVGKALKEDQNIDVVADLRFKDNAAIQAAGGGMSRGGERISDPRTPPKSTWS